MAYCGHKVTPHGFFEPSWNTDKASTVFSEKYHGVCICTNRFKFGDLPYLDVHQNILCDICTYKQLIRIHKLQDFTEITDPLLCKRSPLCLQRRVLWAWNTHTAKHIPVHVTVLICDMSHFAPTHTTNRHWKHGITLPWLLWGAAVPLWLIFIALSCIRSRDGRLWEIRP